MYWPAKSFNNIKHRVLKALKINTSYYNHKIMGLPATYLDPKIFPSDAGFLKDAPYIKCFIENPNHIGLHTYHSSLPAFKGTQDIELELLEICAEKIFKAEHNSYDGYVASGGTECNIQALWIYREFYKKIEKAVNNEIIVLFSEDSHYSLYKACNLLQLEYRCINVESDTRILDLDQLEQIIIDSKKNCKKYFIFVLNMGSTMFGSVDPISKVGNIIHTHKLDCKLHIDAAFGGFIYPFTNPESIYNFKNIIIDSISLDAHKMLQAPYGTGIFLIRKGYIDNILTKEASYIEGQDHTLCGSRPGANAIATWMILNIYGSDNLREHMLQFIEKTDVLCNTLNNLGIEYFRNDNMNIITLKHRQIHESIYRKFTLVPDTHTGDPSWWKIVVMEHVNWDLITQFVNTLKGDVLNSSEIN